jgi:hypothetical protein
MITLFLAYLLNSPATEPATWTTTVALTRFGAYAGECQARAAELGVWSDQKYSPFEDDPKPNPHTPRLLWWATNGEGK